MHALAELIDVGGDFERYYPDKIYVTVTDVDPDTGETLTAAENVPAAKLIETSDTAGARGGEVGVTRCEFVFRCDLLGFNPKPRTLLTVDPGGEAEAVWILDDCKLDGVGGVNALCRSMATRAR